MAKIKKRADDRYQVKIRYDGKQYCCYGKSIQEAREAAARKVSELETGTMNRENPTVKAYYKHFTEERRDKVRGNTIRSQIAHFNTMALVVITENGKTFGQMRMRDVKPGDIEILQRKLSDQGLSARSVNDYIAHMKYFFKKATTKRVIDYNPCDGIDNLKDESAPITTNRHRALTEEEVKTFFNALRERNSYYYYALALLAKTGCRVGEMAALVETDIDREFIHIRRTLTRSEDGAYILGTGAKTYAGKRDIPIDESIRLILAQQRQQNADFFPDGTETLFPAVEGGYLKSYTIDREIVYDLR